MILQMLDRTRGNQIEGAREAEMLRRRTERHNRQLMPLRRMGGNPLGGFF
jgi:hypothetical protein